MDGNEKADRLEEIKDEIKGLMAEAENLLRGTREGDVAKSYWLAHIVTALDKDHGYLGGSMGTMQDTIDALREGEEE